jgi:ATP diphosphatase
MPGLTRALKLQDKAAKVGFDWPALTNVFDKLHEELTELQDAIAAPSVSVDPNDAAHNQAHIEEEFGDLLFVLANIGRHLKIDPEKALRGANQKFIRRFRHIEQRLAEAGRSPAQSNLQEMDELWDEAKLRERS